MNNSENDDSDDANERDKKFVEAWKLYIERAEEMYNPRIHIAMNFLIIFLDIIFHWWMLLFVLITAYRWPTIWPKIKLSYNENPIFTQYCVYTIVIF